MPRRLDGTAVPALSQLCLWVSALVSDAGVIAHDAVAAESWGAVSEELKRTCQLSHDLVTLRGVAQLAMASPLEQQSASGQQWRTEWLQVPADGA